MKSILSSIAFIVVPAVVALAQPAQNQNFGGQPPAGGAQANGPAPNAIFDAIDADADGMITTKELRKAVAALKQLDTDRDGVITREEASPLGGAGGDPAKMVDRVLADHDGDGDGKLSPNEVPQQEAANLAGSDTNGDGAYDRQELMAAMEKMRNQAGMNPGGFNQGQGGPNNAGAHNGDDSIRQLMRGDRNGDGKLTPDEVEPRMHNMLREADTNRDGSIDGQEMRTYVQTMQDRMNGRGPGGQGPNRPGRGGNVPQQQNTR